MQTLMCFAVLARMIEKAETSEGQKRLMQRSVTRMMDVLGGCERIMDTPIPVTTMRHSARSLMIWLACFPICMFPALGVHVMWVAPFAALLLFGEPAPPLPSLTLFGLLYHELQPAGGAKTPLAYRVAV